MDSGENEPVSRKDLFLVMGTAREKNVILT
jgi:hypothetical protein